MTETALVERSGRAHRTRHAIVAVPFSAPGATIAHANDGDDVATSQRSGVVDHSVFEVSLTSVDRLFRNSFPLQRQRLYGNPSAALLQSGCGSGAGPCVMMIAAPAGNLSLDVYLWVGD